MYKHFKVYECMHCGTINCCILKVAMNVSSRFGIYEKDERMLTQEINFSGVGMHTSQAAEEV